MGQFLESGLSIQTFMRHFCGYAHLDQNAKKQFKASLSDNSLLCSAIFKNRNWMKMAKLLPKKNAHSIYGLMYQMWSFVVYNLAKS